MSYQKDRDEFVAVIVEECGRPEHKQHDGVSMSAVALARAILRDAATIQRVAVAECNRELRQGEAYARARAEDRIRERCQPWRIKPTFNGDPRGACVKLVLPSGRWNSFGGKEDGYCVPTR